MALVTSYDAKDTTVMIDGVYITALGEDMVTGEKDEEFSSPSVGAQGDIVINEVNNTLGTVSVSVQPTSPQKPHLLSLAKRKDPFPIWCVNKALGERFGGTKARLKNYPEMSRGSEAEDMSFEFQVYDYTVE